MSLANITVRIAPFLSIAALLPAILFSVFFGLSGRKGAKIFVLFISALSIAAAFFLNIYSYIVYGIFSDYLFSFNLIEAIQTGFILFAAMNIFVFISIYNFERDNFIKIIILFLFNVFIFIFFILSANFIMIFSSMVLLCVAMFQTITVNNSNALQSDKRSVAEYMVKNEILRFFLLAVFSFLLMLAGFSLIFGASDFKTFIQVLESEKIASPLLKTGFLLIFAGIIVYLFQFPCQAGYIRLSKKSQCITNYIIWFFYFPSGIFLFLKLRNVFFYFAEANSTYISLSVLIIAALTAIGGNTGAIKTTSLRRIMSFLFLANIGMMVLLACFYSTGLFDRQRITWLFLANLATVSLSYFPAFSILCFLEKKNGSDSIKNIKGFARQNKYLGSALIISMLSFAGIPAFAGYASRVYSVQPLFRLILSGGTATGQGISSAGNIIFYAAALISAISWLFLAANIIRIIVIMLQKPQLEQKHAFPRFYYIYATVFALIILWTGISFLIEMYGTGTNLTFYPLLNINF